MSTSTKKTVKITMKKSTKLTRILILGTLLLELERRTPPPACASNRSLSLERPVIGHEAPHAPLSSWIYILPRCSRRARALD